MSVLHLENLMDIPNNTLAVIKFYADWCGPCKKYAPTYNKLPLEYPDVVFYAVDTDDEDLIFICRHFEISAMPTFVFHKNGQEVGRVQGANDAQIRSFITRFR